MENVAASHAAIHAEMPLTSFEALMKEKNKQLQKKYLGVTSNSSFMASCSLSPFQNRFRRETKKMQRILSVNPP